MIDPATFLAALDEAGIKFAAGVPDSLLKDVCACITTRFPAERHVIATNEGSAVGLAIGHFLATGRPALVYMQNSGLGNVINPVASLADPLVYGIPMLVMIGWRGEMKADGNQLHDEPQHVKQGQITVAQLDVLGIPYRLLDENTTDIGALTKELTQLALARSGPVALLVRKQTFSAFKFDSKRDDQHLPTREQAIKRLIDALPENTPVVSTTGMASRELFEHRKTSGKGHDHDFLTVGGMGHASQIATGIAIERPGQKVLCIDGDGALLMHMGGLAISGRQSNLIHVVINNGAHDSVGGQPTLAQNLDLASIARDCGYGFVAQAASEQEILDNLQTALKGNCSAFLEIKCKRGARADVGRPDRSPARNKQDFMNFLKSTTGER
jgi:phosphonopyruvate decarboxylase